MNTYDSYARSSPGFAQPTFPGAAHPTYNEGFLFEPFEMVQGDVLVAQLYQGRLFYRPYNLSAPAAGFRNGLFADNGDVLPSWKALLDNTLPVIVTPGGAGAAGTSLLAARRDHAHPATDVASAATVAGHTTSIAAIEAAWVTRAHNAGDFGADVGTWTVQLADLAQFSSHVAGKTMTVSFSIIASSVTVANANYLKILIPQGKTPARTVANSVMASVAGVPLANGPIVMAVNGDTSLRLYVDIVAANAGPAATWGPVPLNNNVDVMGEITFEVA